MGIIDNTSFRDTAFQVIMCSDARVQPNMATPIPSEYFDLRIPDLQRDFYVLDQKVQVILDCGGEETYRKVKRTRIGALKLKFFTRIDLLAPVTAYHAGVASAPSGGAAQVETATIVGTIATAGNVPVTVTAAGMPNSPKTIQVAVLISDNAAAVAAKIRTALAADTDVNGFVNIGGTGAAVILTKKAISPTDASFNLAIANGTAAGLTPITNSANTTPPSPSVHTIEELPRNSFQPPIFSLILQFEGQTKSWLLRGCVSDQLDTEGKAGTGDDADLVTDWLVSFAEMINLDGFVFPGCVNKPTLRFMDTIYTEDGDNFSESGMFMRAKLSLSNEIVKGDSAYLGNTLAPSRLQRASARKRSMDTSVLGSDRDPLFIDALDIDEDVDWNWQIGSDTENVTYSSDKSTAMLEGGKLQKIGELNETAIARNLEPNEPINITVKNGQTTQYLLPAV